MGVSLTPYGHRVKKMAYVRKIRKLGGSKVVSLPAPLCAYLRFRLGEYLLFELVDDGSLRLSQVDFQKRPDLKILLDQELPSIDYEKRS